MDTKTKEQIEAKLKNSTADPAMKDFFLSRLHTFTEEQSNELLKILQSEEEMITKEVDRVNSGILKKLMEDMKVLSDDLIKKTRVEIERRDVEKDQAELKSLEDEINSI